MQTRSFKERDSKVEPNKVPKTKKTRANIIYYRTSTAAVNKEGEAIKHCFFGSSNLFSEKSTSPRKIEELKGNFCKRVLGVMSEDPSYRPAKITKLTNGIPTKAVTLTPSKTELTVHARYHGSHIEFSNETITHTPTKPKKRKMKKKKKRTLKVESPNTIEKTQTIFIDANMMAKVRAQIKKNHGRRKKSQNSVMGGSANDYAESLGKFLKSARWEWLHLIAHRFLADKAQDPKNLVEGTNHANTQNMFAEDEIEFLLKYYPEGIEFTVKSRLEPKTHIAIDIEYTIKTKDFSHRIVFDAQHPVKPHIHEKNSFHAIFAGLVSAHSKDDITIHSSPKKKKARKSSGEQNSVKQCWMPVTPKKTSQNNSSQQKNNNGLLPGEPLWHLKPFNPKKLTPSKLGSFFYHSPSPLKLKKGKQKKSSHSVLGNL